MKCTQKEKIFLLSLGCPKNQVDAENMLGLLAADGYRILTGPEEAEVIIVNTCGFIEQAKEESIEEILRMAEYKKSGNCRALIMAGCLGERYAEELLAELPEVDAISGAHAWDQICETVQKALQKKRFIYTPENAPVEKVLPRKLEKQAVTAYLKIAEGCDNACSYCAIPKIRGPYVSKPLPVILEEARQLLQTGVKELILVAQDVTRYGEDLYGKLMLADLLRQLCRLEGLVWLRILYAYPQYITDELIDVIAEEEQICSYLDIPLQHASSSVLERMNRRDTKESITALLAKLRRKLPGVCLRTTFIVGFPGETQAEYQELKEFLLEQKFDRVGIFTYSQEDGTLAAELEQVEEEVKQERYHELMALQAQVSEEKNISLEETEFLVLVEKVALEGHEQKIEARSYREAPEIDGLIYLESKKEVLPGSFVKARILQGFAYDLLAEVLE